MRDPCAVNVGVLEGFVLSQGSVCSHPFPIAFQRGNGQSCFIRESKLILGGIWGFFQFRNSPVFLQMGEKRARRVVSAACEQAVGLSLCDRQML